MHLGSISQRQWKAILISLVLFSFVMGVIQPVSIRLATHAASNSVTDVVLSNIPVYEVDGIFVYGTFIMVAYIMFLCVRYPRRLPFMINTLSLFLVIRAIFVLLTHIGPFIAHTSTDFGPTITKMFFGADFFFSGHTGVPFLFALMYWREKLIRSTFLLFTGMFAVIVLLGHLHYSIDVAAAFFITYTIYHIALRLFPISRQWFLDSDPIEKKIL